MNISEFYKLCAEYEFAIPLLQVVLFITVNSFCLLYGKFRLGLLVSYGFVFYWGYIFNLDFFVKILGASKWGLVFYGASGLLMFIVAIIGLIANREEYS